MALVAGERDGRAGEVKGKPAAIAVPNATNNKITVGNPDNNSALCNAFSFNVLKSCHTAHSPVTSADAPAGNDTAFTVAIT